MAEPFVFETTYDPGAAQDEFAKQLRSTPQPRGDQMLIVGGLVGFALLIWPYTIALGAFIIAISTFGYAMKTRSRISPSASRAAEPSPMHVRITDEGYWLSWPTSSAQGTWANVRGFMESSGYLVLHAWHVGRIYLPIEEMRSSGVYERVRALADERRRTFSVQLEKKR